MAIELVKYEMNVPKESKELVDLLAGIAELAVIKAEINEYLTLIKEFTDALDGVQKIGDEVKSGGRDEIAGYLLHRLMGSIAPIKEEVEVPVV